MGEVDKSKTAFVKIPQHFVHQNLFKSDDFQLN